MLLVVLGHCIMTWTVDWQSDSFQLGGYMFHMPVFMLMSGYFFFPSVTRLSLFPYVKKKFIRLMLPALVWGGVWCTVMLMGKIHVGKSVDVAYLLLLLITKLWFFPVLFILLCVGRVIYLLDSRMRPYAWGAFFLATYFSPFLFPLLNEIRFLLPFFLMGVIWKKHVRPTIPFVAASIALAVFMVCLSKFTFDDTVYCMGDDVLSASFMWSYGLRLVSGVAGCIFFVWLCQQMMRSRKLSAFLSYIGTMTLPIYVSHQLFIFMLSRVINTNGNYLFAILMAIVVTACSVILYRMLSHPVLRQWLYGESA